MSHGRPSDDAPMTYGGLSLDDGDRGEVAVIRTEATVDQDRIRRAVREILLAIGEDPDREGLRETPDRVARMYSEVFQGLHQDPVVHLAKRFTLDQDLG